MQGSVLGGWSFHLLGDGRLCYVHNLAGWRVYRVEGPVGERLGPGDHTLAFRFVPARTAPPTEGFCWSTARWSPPATIERTTWSRFSLTGAGLTVGWSPDFSPADHDYRGPFRFTGHLDRVEIDVDGEGFVDADAEAADALRAQ